MTPCTGEVADSPSGHGGFWGPVRSEYTDLNGHGLDGHGYLYPFCFTILETRIMYLHVFIIRKKDIINVISDFTFILSGKMTLFGTNRQVLQSSCPICCNKSWAQSCCKLSHCPFPSNSNRSKTSFFVGAKKQKAHADLHQDLHWKTSSAWSGTRQLRERCEETGLGEGRYSTWTAALMVCWEAWVKTWWNIYPDFFGKKRVRVYLKYKQPRNLYNIDTKNCQF